jgi:hypothetical protein
MYHQEGPRKQGGIGIGWTHQLLVCGDVNLWEKNINILKNTDVLLDANKKISLEVNAGGMCICVSIRQQDKIIV